MLKVCIILKTWISRIDLSRNDFNAEVKLVFRRMKGLKSKDGTHVKCVNVFFMTQFPCSICAWSSVVQALFASWYTGLYFYEPWAHLQVAEYICMCVYVYVCHRFGPSWLPVVRRLKLGNPSYVALLLSESEKDATKHETKARVMIFKGSLQKKNESVDQSCMNRPYFHEAI